MLIIYFSATPISLCYTSIIQNQGTQLVHPCTILGIAKANEQCNVLGNLSGRFSMTRYRVLARRCTTQLYFKLVALQNATVVAKQFKVASIVAGQSGQKCPSIEWQRGWLMMGRRHRTCNLHCSISCCCCKELHPYVKKCTHLQRIAPIYKKLHPSEKKCTPV